MRTTRRYRIAGKYWKQRPLTYGVFVDSIMAIGLNWERFSTNQLQLGEYLRTLTDQKVLPRLFAVILEEDNRLWRGWVNRWKPEITRQNVAEHCTGRDIGKVLKDFFVLNVAWLATWLNSPIDVGFLLTRLSPLELVSVLRRLIISRRLSRSASIETSPSPTPAES